MTKADLKERYPKLAALFPFTEAELDALTPHGSFYKGKVCSPNFNVYFYSDEMLADRIKEMRKARSDG